MTGAVAKGKFLYYRSRGKDRNGKRHHVPAKQLESQVAFVLTSVTVPRTQLASLDIDDSMRLALQVAQNVGAVYQLPENSAEIMIDSGAKM